MENMMNNYYGQQQVGMGGMAPYYGGYDPNMYSYQTYGFNNVPMPANQNALTAEEIQILKNARPSSKIDLSVDRNDVLRSMCTHKDGNRDVVQQINDGSGDVYCPICQIRWNPDLKDKEEVAVLVNSLVDQMENSKWIGDLPVELTRELFTLIPLLKKYPDIHEYAMNTFNKYYNARGIYNSQDTNIYGMYNSLYSNAPAGGYAPVSGGYYSPQMSMNQGYYGQQAPAMNQGYVPNSVGNPMQANAMVNPMQAPVYGVNPMATNQQFVSQANMMMGGTVQNPYSAPVYNTPQQTQAAPQQPVQQPAAPQQGPTITPQADGTVKSENKIDL